jgi:glycosyltransferase involved in cell wall biosynthesis
MDFSIVTPSFRNSQWLKLCVASVADQQGVTFEHIVQDSCSDDGTLDWLVQDQRVQAVVEKDKGMYDAVNRGYRRAKGELLGYINCDEQYLPGALAKVKEAFDHDPEVDVAFGDCIVVDGAGNYLCERRVLTPQLLHTWTTYNLSFLTAAMFLRRRLVHDRHFWFRSDLRDVGDGEWALRLVKARVRMTVVPQFISVFTETGQNMNLLPNAAREGREFRAQAPWWARRLRPLTTVHFRLRRWRSGHYSCRPHEYAIYTHASPTARKRFVVDKPTFRWHRPPQRSV